MSENAEGSSTQNGTSAPEKKPFPRLSSFKQPRDLTLGGHKVPKKIYVPNLSAVRNKNKSALPVRENNKRDNDRHRKDRNQGKNNNRNQSKIVKSSGVFSEGLGATERPSTRSSSYGLGRGGEGPPVLTKPTIRVKDVWKIDKELEEQNIKKVMDDAGDCSDEDDAEVDLSEAPVRLPISAGGSLYSVKKLEPAVKVKHEIKQEPHDPISVAEIDKKPIPWVKSEPLECADMVTLLKSEQPKMMLLQLPDNLPGRGQEEDTHPKAKTSKPDDEENKPIDNKCRLTDLEEGRIGKILVYKSGKVKMSLGDTLFDVTLGTLPCFRQDVMSVATDADSRTGIMINLGGVEKKLTVIPDWEALFRDVVI